MKKLKKSRAAKPAKKKKKSGIKLKRIARKKKLLTNHPGKHRKRKVKKAKKI
jgi:hypothetical protein